MKALSFGMIAKNIAKTWNIDGIRGEMLGVMGEKVGMMGC